jgi:hypothetical protein
VNASSLDTSPQAVDRLTVVAIAIVAYCVTNVVHEGLGHGNGLRLLAAGGGIANLVLAAAAFVILRLWRSSPEP